MTPLVQDRLAQLPSLTLDRSGHASFEEGHCATELVSWLAGEPFSDHPDCLSPVLGAFLRNWNDSLDDEGRQKLPAVAVCAALSLGEGIHTNAGLLAGAALVMLLLCVSLAWPAALGMGDVKLALLILCAMDAATAAALILTLELYALVALLLLIRHGRAALGTSLPLAPILAVSSLIALLTT